MIEKAIYLSKEFITLFNLYSPWSRIIGALISILAGVLWYLGAYVYKKHNKIFLIISSILLFFMFIVTNIIYIYNF